MLRSLPGLLLINPLQVRLRKMHWNIGEGSRSRECQCQTFLGQSWMMQNWRGKGLPERTCSSGLVSLSFNLLLDQHHVYLCEFFTGSCFVGELKST